MDFKCYNCTIDPNDNSCIIVDIGSIPSAITGDTKFFEFSMVMQLCSRGHPLTRGMSLEQLKSRIYGCGECASRFKCFKIMIAFQSKHKMKVHKFRLWLPFALHNRYFNREASSNTFSTKLRYVSIPYDVRKVGTMEDCCGINIFSFWVVNVEESFDNMRYESVDTLTDTLAAINMYKGAGV